MNDIIMMGIAVVTTILLVVLIVFEYKYSKKL